MIDGWLGMFAPAGTPKDVIARISALVQEAARESSRIKGIIKSFGLKDRPMTAEEFEKFDKEVKPQWVGLARELGVTLD